MKFNKLFTFAAGSLTFLLKTPYKMSPEPPAHQQLRGQYEDKIRRYSPPEKIFFVFANKNQNGQFAMSLQALLRSICFYNYSQSDEQNVKTLEAQNLIKFFGLQSDYSIYEYFNLVRFMTFHRFMIQDYYKRKGITKLKKQDFKDMMINQVCKDYSEHIKQSLGFESRQFKPSKQQYLKVIERQAESLYKDKKSYTYDQFIDFRFKIIKQIYGYQFKIFKKTDQQIDGIDFARSIIKYTQNLQHSKLMRRIRSLKDDLETIKVSENQYVGFHLYILTMMSQFESALNQKGALNKIELQNMINKFEDESHKVSDSQIQIFFQLLDTDNSGFIEKRELLGVMQSLKYYTNIKSGELTISEVFQKKQKNGQINFLGLLISFKNDLNNQTLICYFYKKNKMQIIQSFNLIYFNLNRPNILISKYQQYFFSTLPSIFSAQLFLFNLSFLPSLTL